MLNIKLYGKRTSGYSFVKEYLTDFLLFNNLEYNLLEINNVNDFIEHHINSIPCVVINDTIKIEVNKQESIKKAILHLYHSIIDTVGIQNVRKIIIPFDYSKASINTVQQTRVFLKSNHYVILLAFMPNLSINDEDACKIEKLYTSDKMRSISEKLEDDYIGDIANITPIYSQAINRCAWPSILENESKDSFDLLLYNVDSQLIPLNRKGVETIFDGKKETLIIYNNTHLNTLHGIEALIEKGHGMLVESSGIVASPVHIPSSVDTFANEPPVATFTRFDFKNMAFETMALLDECLQNKIPILII